VSTIQSIDLLEIQYKCIGPFALLQLV
jgi:hypothetical protein